MRARAEGPARALLRSAPARRPCPWSWSRWRQDPRLGGPGAASALTTRGERGVRGPARGSGPPHGQRGDGEASRDGAEPGRPWSLHPEPGRQLVQPGVLGGKAHWPLRKDRQPSAEPGPYTTGEKTKTSQAAK